MRTFRLTTLVGTISILLLLISTASAVTIHGDILLTDGNSYEEVVMVVNNNFKTIHITDGSGKKIISFHFVARIMDQNGDDITRSVIGRDSRQPTVENEVDTLVEQAKQEAEKRIAGHNWRQGQTILWPHMSFVGGELGGGIGLSVFIHEIVSLRFDVERTTKTIESVLPGISPNTVTVDQTTNKFLIGVQFTNRLSDPREELSLIYVGGGLGRISQQLSFIDTKDSRIMTYVGGGTVVGLSDKIGVEFGANVDVFFEDEGDRYLLDLNFGLVILLN